MSTLPFENDPILRSIFDALNVGIVVADDSATYRDANQLACDLYGRSRDALVGAHVSEFIENARRQEVDVQWRAFLRDGSQNGVFRILRSDGTTSEFVFHATANVVPGLHVSFLTPASPEPEHPNDASSRITLCAWTKRVLFGDRWVSVEEYLDSAHGVSVSHGLSPDAAFNLFSSGDTRPDP